MTEIRLPSAREQIQLKHIAPEEACALNDLAHELGGMGKTTAALTALRRARALAPGHPIILSSLGSVLYDAGLYAEAEAVLQRSIVIEPDYAPTHGNLGSVLSALDRFREAKLCFQRALSIEEGFTDAKWNYAISLLDHGEWTEGFKYYENRCRRGGERLYPTLPYPTWKGESLNGKTLYVQGEQGIGDRTLFSRYLAWVKRENPEAKIKYMLNAEDLPDISNFMWGIKGTVDEFLPNGIPWPEADYGIYLMSLPGLHGSTPDNVPADPGHLRNNALRHKNSVQVPSVNNPSALKVGICWTGSVGMKRNAERSIPLEQLLTLAELPGVVLYSLQFKNGDINRVGADHLVCDLTPDIAPLGFTGTAAVMLNLDLVITCCTSVAHVAGVLGVPCWTLLCANPYWLWGRDGSQSVWYPNTRLFRQARMNDWEPVISNVRDELAAMAEGAIRNDGRLLRVA